MSLTGIYRTTYREQCGMILLRRKGLSINQIAGVLKRSTKTVWKYTKAMERDNRRQSWRTRGFNAMTFRGRLHEFSVRVRLFLRGLSWDEAMKIPIGGLAYAFLSDQSKNISEEEEEDPA